MEDNSHPRRLLFQLVPELPEGKGLHYSPLPRVLHQACVFGG